ncbi:response regulator transcription factor [Kribbella jejuensis]|uniref:LuxR family two component transcriptional regulator n=1 Tax=Kribbella jejuensis TaxID=236068 RepID=A0A542DAV2_9ACTN|nr:response regulator transcription factor [Kribbella jejuensis]TQJ00197.1 LuxR family two component transcriptional regulator [Kribbella jejuensis]
MTIRVVLADDHPVIRDGLQVLLASVDGISVVGVAANGPEAVRAAVTLKPDVLVMDIHMPGGDGVTAAQEVARVAPTVGVLMLTMLDDEETVRAAVRAGAAGYVLKGASQQQIVRAIETVAAGDAILGSGVARPVLDALAGRSAAPPDPLAGLTPRERQIVELLASGLSTTAIAGRLALTTKTVNNNLSVVFGKLGVANRTEAALLARGVLGSSAPTRDRGPGGFGG